MDHDRECNKRRDALDRQCSTPGSIMKLRFILASYSGTHQHKVAKAASWRGCHTSGARLPLTNLLPQLLC